ncbi:MAG: CDP-alcohol phosphatidyltransferase family protein [Gammaproteobacteria bacterium]|nr:CDP-alcohol phosphatidyltransferase family protein [Gammaproteobacteria bacterium]
MSDTLRADTQQTPIDGLLKREFFLIGCLGLAGLVVGGLLLGLQWLAQAGLIWAFICYQTKRRLPLNRPSTDAPLYKNLGWANRLTLLRAWFIAAVAGFLFQAWPEGPALSWLPGMLYLFAAVLDRVDGFVARRSGQSSILGNDLDTVSDAIGLAIASLLAFGYGQVHWSYLLFGNAYYLFHAGIMWRNSRGLPVYPLPPALHRRTWAGFQMGFLAVALWPLVRPPITTLGGFAFMLPAILGFLVDWLIVSGRIDRQAEAVNRRFQWLTDFSQGVFQPALRLVVVVTLAVSVLQSGLPLLPSNSPTWMNNIMVGGFILAGLMILLGVAGRYFSLIMVSLLGWYYISNPLLPVDYILFCSVVWVLLLGTGRFSLWQEDDHWLNRYDGA